ncbi:MAG: SDR family NAD(P)-dependent oxidoreductase, partial [Actinomycetota bacterium]
MDLGITGRRAIVCASSRGLGLACADSLGREGVDLWINAREPARLEAAAADLRDRHGVQVTAVAGDIGAEATRAELVERCPAPDILVNNNGGPDPGRFQG